MPEIYFNPHIKARPRPTVRLNEAIIRERYGVETVYPLALNENPLGASPKVAAALAEAVPNLSYYPHDYDIALRTAIADHLGQGLTPEHVYTGCSGFESLELMARGFLRPNDEVIISSPTFTAAYTRLATAQGASVIDVPLQSDTYAYDVDGVLNAITDQTRLIFVCNPNNPTGTVIPQDQINALVTGLPDHVILVADEVYHHFVQRPDFPNTIQYAVDAKNVVVVHTFSKAYGLAGLRLGYGIARPELANYIGAMHRGFHQNKLAIAAGVAALNDQDHLRYVVSTINAEKAYLAAELDRLDVAYTPSETNFMLFETSLLADDLAEKMLHYGVWLRPQTDAGMPYKMRISIGTHEANRAFITALEVILHEARA